MGTLTLTYDDGEYGGGCELRLTFDSETAGAWRYSCNSGNQDQGDWRVSITDSAVGRELEFSEGESTTRSIPENTPAGINVGPPVSAAALTANRIGGADIQVFQVSDPGIQPAAYRPGDWLEPKDGSDQRMMIVGIGQIAAAARLSPPHWEAATLAYTPSFLGSPVFALPAVLSGEPAVARLRLASAAPHFFESSRGIYANLHANAEPAITQLSVVCMQRDHGIPTRGARYFSKPKAAEGPVQMCQRECVLNETDNIQECVWRCEEN